MTSDAGTIAYYASTLCLMLCHHYHVPYVGQLS